MPYAQRFNNKLIMLLSTYKKSCVFVCMNWKHVPLTIHWWPFQHVNRTTLNKEHLNSRKHC